MSWNGSGDNGRARTPAASQKKAGGISPAVVKGAFGGLLVVAVIFAAFLIFRGESSDGRARTPAAPKKIREVTPAPAPKAKTAEPEPEKPKKLPPQQVGEVRNGYRLLPSGRLHRVKGEIHVGGGRDSLVDKTFDHGSDRMIAHMLMAEPGATMVGDSASTFQGFDEVFKKSLKDDIVIRPDDDEDVKNLKQAVLDARKELLENMAKSGKSAEALMIETREQLRELTLYREDLEQEVSKLVADGMSQKDYDELIGAANLMLEERGCKKIEMPHLVADVIEMNYRRKESELQRKAQELEKTLKEE